MREFRSSGSVEGVRGNHDSYSDQPTLAIDEHRLRSLLGPLLEHVGDHDCIRIGSVDDPPRHGCVVDAQLLQRVPIEGIRRE